MHVSLRSDLFFLCRTLPKSFVSGLSGSSKNNIGVCQRARSKRHTLRKVSHSLLSQFSYTIDKKELFPSAFELTTALLAAMQDDIAMKIVVHW